MRIANYLVSAISNAGLVPVSFTVTNQGGHPCLQTKIRRIGHRSKATKVVNKVVVKRVVKVASRAVKVVNRVASKAARAVSKVAVNKVAANKAVVSKAANKVVNKAAVRRAVKVASRVVNRVASRADRTSHKVIAN
jgi:hypothetical protein